MPQFLLEHLDSRGQGGAADIIVTQPRRISAMSLAQRVAQEREVEGDKLGDTVGYQIRLESMRSSKTRLLYCTIGVLLRRLSTDRLLSGISHIIVDEVHERDRLADFLLVILRDLLPHRPNLKVILMSATLNAELFSRYFTDPRTGHPCPHIHIAGFTYPVHTFYLEDVIELTGYTPPQLSKADSAKRRQQVDAAKEKRLVDVLNRALNQVLTIEATQPTKSKGGLVPEGKGVDDDEEGKDDDAALAALARIANMSGDAPASSSSSLALSGLDADNAVTGWTDTFVYKPAVENPWAAETMQAQQGPKIDAASMQASLDAIIAGDNVMVRTSPEPDAPAIAAAPASSSSPPLHPSQISSAALSSSLQKSQMTRNATQALSSTLQNPLSGLNYSDATMEVLRQLEESGMDFIDYDLILRVILFICQRFDESHLEAGKTAAGVPHSDDDSDDPINISNGSILVFVPGWEDICTLLDMVALHPQLKKQDKFLCLPLHGSISSAQQRQIFLRPRKGQRKIIFSTNLAETSIVRIHSHCG